MTSTQVTISIISLCLAISGWGKLIYDHIMNKPKIKGRVFPALVGQFPNPTAPNKEMMTAFFMYLYLTNSRKSSIHIIDYKIEAIFADGEHVSLQRVYGLERSITSFADPQGTEIKLPNLKEQLIYKKTEPVAYGVPLHGFLMAAGPGYLYDKRIAEYIIIAEDVLGKEHKLRLKRSEFGDLSLLSEIAEFEIPQTAIVERSS